MSAGAVGMVQQSLTQWPSVRRWAQLEAYLRSARSGASGGGAFAAANTAKTECNSMREASPLQGRWLLILLLGGDLQRDRHAGNDVLARAVGVSNRPMGI
jgi:hypothetical protein